MMALRSDCFEADYYLWTRAGDLIYNLHAVISRLW